MRWLLKMRWPHEAACTHPGSGRRLCLTTCYPERRTNVLSTLGTAGFRLISGFLASGSIDTTLPDSRNASSLNFIGQVAECAKARQQTRSRQRYVDSGALGETYTFWVRPEIESPSYRTACNGLILNIYPWLAETPCTRRFQMMTTARSTSTWWLCRRFGDGRTPFFCRCYS